jgi:tetratricopeptide (TPR) repeat protein
MKPLDELNSCAAPSIAGTPPAPRRLDEITAHIGVIAALESHVLPKLIQEAGILKYDRFDMLTATCAAGLLLGAGLVGASIGTPASQPRVTAGSARSVIADLTRARAAIDAGKDKKAIEQLKTFVTANPDIAEPHVLLAKANASLGDYATAIREYKTAVTMDPEYADQNSDKYIGKGIKSVLSHGWAPCEITLKPERNDAARAAVKEDAAYLQRMLAGGCN